MFSNLRESFLFVVRAASRALGVTSSLGSSSKLRSTDFLAFNMFILNSKLPPFTRLEKSVRTDFLVQLMACGSHFILLCDGSLGWCFGCGLRGRFFRRFRQSLHHGHIAGAGVDQVAGAVSDAL